MLIDKVHEFVANLNTPKFVLVFQTDLLKYFFDPKNPISIAGLTIGALLLIFLAILKLKIFPKLNQKLGSDLIQAMMKYLFILALVSIILGFLSNSLSGTINLGKITPTPTPVITPTQTSTPTMTPDSYDMKIRKDETLLSALELFARLDNSRLDVKSNCPKPFMNHKMTENEPIEGKNYLEMMKKLNFYFVEPKPKMTFSVNKTEQRIYEINCETKK